MKKIFLMLVVISGVCALLSCSGEVEKIYVDKETGEILDFKPSNNVDTLVVIGVWRQKEAYLTNSCIDIEFSKGVSARYKHKNKYDNMKYNSPFYVCERDTCVIERLADGRVRFIANLTKTRIDKAHK